MKKILCTFCMLIISSTTMADIVYVNDAQNLSLYDAASSHSNVIKVLPTDTALTVLDKKPKNGFINVQLTDGTEGYIKARYTKIEPPEIDPKDSSSKAMSVLQSNNVTLRAELSALKETLTPGTSLEKSLAIERDKLTRELNELKKTMSSSAQLRNERDELQERVVNVERDLQQYKLENQALKDTASQDWFLYGGLLSLFGVLLGFILPKLGWRRKSSWDSY
ncbi:MAG: TIGR04211 family SH3 domain-containing protein [Methylococcales bacterium]|nr:TIGR04211 family SH3 domain-containing protein [Methylococcales bacterium]